VGISLRGLFDSETIPDEWLFERMRIQRDRLLAESDWTQLPDSSADKQAWADYRQALRDLPATWTPGPTVEFPTPPGG
jgi:hypothetical protein